MKLLRWKLIVPALLLAATACVSGQQEAVSPMTQTDPFEQLGVYVVSADLARSEAFYEAVFERPAQVKLDDFMAFEIAGGWFAVVNRDTFAPQAKIGGNAVPYIRVADIRNAYDHIETIEPNALMGSGLIEEGPVSLFKFSDPDGNVIEYYALSKP